MAIFLEQLIGLLSQPPGSIIYHVLVLFALQVVLALTYVRWQRDPNDEGARRMTLAAGGILAARVLVLLVALFVDQDPERARIVLPPVEQAIDAATVALLVWGLVMFAEDRPRLADGVLLAALILITVMLLFFIQDWQSRAATGVSYNSTVQAYVWGALQVIVLGAGLVWLLVDRQSRLSLRPVIIGVPLLMHVIQFLNYPEFVPTSTEVPYWVRLGYLIAFPLWAVLAYRESMRDLVSVTEAERETAAQLARTLRLSTAVVGARMGSVGLDRALDMVARLVPARFVTIGLLDERQPQVVTFSHSRPAAPRESARSWQLDLRTHAPLRLAYEQQRGIELLPRGVGARQVHELSQQFDLGAFGPVFIQPLLIDERCLGFLLLAAAPEETGWSDRDRALTPELAAFLAEVIAHDWQTRERARAEPVTAAALVASTIDAAETQKLILELAETRQQLEEAEQRTRQAEAVAVYLQQRQPGQPTTALPQLAETAVGPAVEAAVAVFAPLILARNLRIDLAIERNLPLAAVKESVFQQLITNLLENACRASVEDGWVMIRSHVLDGNGRSFGATRRLHLTFSDSGGGVSADDQMAVFEPANPATGNGQIAGLGISSQSLALMKRLAQVSGGDLNFESKPGKGTRFTLWLPVVDVQPVSMLPTTPPLDLKRAVTGVEATPEGQD